MGKKALFIMLIIMVCASAVYGQSALVPKTGQTTNYDTRDDGSLQKGTAWPSPRFTDNGNGTVTDNLTGLIWLKNANCFGARGWATALSDANSLSSGSCGLTDGSAAGDWRLPNVDELESLVDTERSSPALPTGHPFTNVQSSYYWSSSTYANYTSSAWVVYMPFGSVNLDGKAVGDYVWPVRAGQVGNLVNLAISKAGTGTGTVTSSDGKANCGSTCTVSYNTTASTLVTLTATASSGSTFTGWSGACTGSSTCQLTMDAAKNVTATFDITTSSPTSTLTIKKAGIGGSGTITSADGNINCGMACTRSYNTGTIVTITATPDTGSTFTGWSGGSCTGTGTCSTTLNGDTTVTATFNSSLPTPDSATYGPDAVAMNVTNSKGKQQELIVVPPANLTFTKLVSESTPDTSGAVQFQTGNSANSPTITLSFSVSGAQPGVMNDVTFYLPQGANMNTIMKYGHKESLSTTEWYNFSCDTRGGARPCGESVVEGGQKKIILHLQDGKLGDNDLTVNGVIDDPVTFAYFETTDNEGGTSTNPDMSEVSIKSGSGGTISPSGIKSYNVGQLLPITIIPERGFHIADVKIDGKSVGPVHEYTLKITSTTHIIEATFEMGQVQVNGQNTPITIKSGETLTVDVSLNNRGTNLTGDVDWRLAVNTPSGWYHYDAATGQWKEGLAASYRGPLFNLQSFEALKITNLPAGTYTFSFGINKNAGKSIGYNESATYDSVAVTVEGDTGRTLTFPDTAAANWARPTGK